MEKIKRILRRIRDWIVNLFKKPDSDPITIPDLPAEDATKEQLYNCLELAISKAERFALSFRNVITPGTGWSLNDLRDAIGSNNRYIQLYKYFSIVFDRWMNRKPTTINVKVCIKSEKLLSDECKVSIEKTYKIGTEPKEFCTQCASVVPFPIDMHGTRIGYGSYGALDPNFDYKNFFKILYSCGVNLVRVFGMSTWNNYFPWKKLAEHQYDITRLDGNYFEHLKNFVTEAKKYGIIVMIDLFDECGLETKWNRWEVHAFNSKNNINGYINSTCGVPDFYNGKYWPQQAMYIDKVLETLKDFDNVIYEMVNEPSNKAFDEKVWKYLVSKGVQHTSTSGECHGPTFWSTHQTCTANKLNTNPIMLYSDDGKAWPRTDLKTPINWIKKYKQGFEFIQLTNGFPDIELLTAIKEALKG
jgi:hypothetical protein